MRLSRSMPRHTLLLLFAATRTGEVLLAAASARVMYRHVSSAIVNTTVVSADPNGPFLMKPGASAESLLPGVPLPGELGIFKKLLPIRIVFVLPSSN